MTGQIAGVRTVGTDSVTLTDFATRVDHNVGIILWPDHFAAVTNMLGLFQLHMLTVRTSPGPSVVLFTRLFGPSLTAL
jgi:hypothetical protein